MYYPFPGALNDKGENKLWEIIYTVEVYDKNQLVALKERISYFT